MSENRQNEPFTPSPIVALLATRHEPCPRCNYDLHKVAAEACPECALPLELQLKGATSLDRSWYLAVISLAMGMGFDLVLAGDRGFVVLIGSAGKGDAVMVLGFLFLGAMCAFGLRWLFVAQERWRARPPRQRTILSASTALITLVVHVLWGVTIIAITR